MSENILELKGIRKSFAGVEVLHDVSFELRPGEVHAVSVAPHDHGIQIFFLGFGDADFDIGRILAQATGAEFRGSTEEDLASVIEELSGYF